MSHLAKPRRDVARHRASILDAASRVFADQGVNASMDAVADAADVARATLYRHFPDRAALLMALYDRDMAEIAPSTEIPSADALIALIVRLARAARQAPAIAEIWRSISPGNIELQRRQNALLAHFKPLVEAGTQSGELRPDLTAADVFRIIRMIAAPSDMPGEEDQVPDVAAERLLDLVLNGVRRRG